jgi:primosomal replication protein N
MASDNPDLRLIEIKAENLMGDRLTADVNQLTISGTVERPPELQYDYEGDPVCSFVLTHTIDHQESGHWELQHYHVSLYGGLGEAFRTAYQPGQKVVVDRPERRCRQGHEDLWMLCHRLRHALAPTRRRASIHELPDVPAILMRAARAARLTPVTAPDHQRPVRLVDGRAHARSATHHHATQSDRMTARTRALPLPANGARTNVENTLLWLAGAISSHGPVSAHTREETHVSRAS